MALRFQYNKVSMQALQKELKMRVSALPTLKSKESYLRVTIKREKQCLESLREKLETKRSEIGAAERLFAEFPSSLVHVDSVKYGTDNVAGIKVLSLDDIRFRNEQRSVVLDPAWFPWGITEVENIVRRMAEISVYEKRVEQLEYARKKTTQKVNLYEKVQIPEYSEAVLKIKRFLEDVENLEKAAQKITKSRQKAAQELA